jgi:aminocarboxymuconate-semialdehyde decarboxylase
MLHWGCTCCVPSRRSVLQRGMASAALSAAGLMGGSAARAEQKSAAGVGGARPIDTHAHYFPEAYLDVFNAEGRRFNAEFRKTEQGFYYKTPGQTNGPLPLNFIDLNARIADMDARGVAIHALSLTGPMVYWADAEVSHKLAKEWNDAAVAAHLKHPDRFVVLATLPMLDSERAIDELNRVSKLAGVRGIYMGTNIEGRDLDDAQFEAIFARIEELDLPVFLHPLGPPIGGKRMQPYSFTNMLAFPFDTTTAACHLIFGGVMDRHPKLKVNLPHAGGVLPTLIGRLDHGFRSVEAMKRLAQAPSSYLRRFTYDTITHSKPVMEFVISQVGVDRIMMGSDYCFEVGVERPVQFVEQLDLSAEERRMILRGTAAQLLKIG